MAGIAVAVLTEDREQQAILQNRVEATHVAGIVFSHVGFPLGATDPVVRQMQDQRAEVVIVDVNSADPQRAIRAIELILATTSDMAIFAIGDMRNPMAIVGAMRAGAGEFVDRMTGTEGLLEAFTRFSVAHNKTRRIRKGRVFTVINAKGGAGATTVAVNTAVALQQHHGQTILVDFASVGHAALHLNARPTFSVMDALQNLHRMDASLLAGLMTSTKDGLHLLAGPQQPYTETPTADELTRFFDILGNQHRYVVVDCSSRLDQITRLLSDLSNAVLLVAQTDVASLWSAGRIRTFLEEGNSRIRPRLVMNRYKKLPGFTEDDIEKATNCKVLSKIPDSYTVGLAIDKGVPVTLQDKHGVGQSFVSLARLLAAEEESGEDGWSSPPRGSEPPGGSSAPAVPVGLPRSGGPRTLPPKKMARGA